MGAGGRLFRPSEIEFRKRRFHPALHLHRIALLWSNHDEVWEDVAGPIVNRGPAVTLD
jgi:hypothetical protein